MTITLNEDGSLVAEVDTSFNQLSAILRKAMAKAPPGVDNPKIKFEFGVKKITVGSDKNDETNTIN